MLMISKEQKVISDVTSLKLRVILTIISDHFIARKL